MSGPAALRVLSGIVALVATLWGVLRAGDTLEAPPRLPEAWLARAPAGCGAAETALHLSQSGVFVELAWPGGPAEHLRGRLVGSQITLTGSSATCDRVRLEGTLDEHRLDAHLSACAPCASAALSAAPQAP